MKTFFKIIVFFVFTSVYSQQEYSGGIETATGFKVSDPQPIDDRTVVVDSISLLSLPNKYAGLTSYSRDDDALFVFDGFFWNRIKTEIPALAPVATSNDYNDLDSKPIIPAQFNPTAGTGISVSGTYPNLTISNSMPNLLQDFENTLTIGNLVGGAAASAGFAMSSIDEETSETYNTQVTKSIVSVSHRPDSENPLTTLTMSGLTQSMRLQIGNNEVAQFGVFNNDLGIHFHDFFETESISITAPEKTGIRVQELQDKSGTIALLSDISESIENSFSAIEVDANLTLDDTHKNKQILITGNDRVVTIPNTLPNNFNVTLDFSGTGAILVDESSGTGDTDHTTSPYDIPQNGMIYIYKTESGTVRIKGDIL